MTNWPQFTVASLLVLWVIAESVRWVSKQPEKDRETSIVASVLVDGLQAGAIAIILGYGGFWDVFK